MEGVGFTSSMGRDQFMNLLVTQMRNQNPLDPINDSEFIAQLAQFSTLEGVEKLNTSFGDMLKLQQLTQGANLVGRVAVFERADSSEPVRGVVQGVSVLGQKLNLLIGNELVPLESVRGLANAT
jgi:flagellar basal-body rod modification protein FlgD